MDPADLYDDDPGHAQWAEIPEPVAELYRAVWAAEARADRAEAALGQARREGAVEALRERADEVRRVREHGLRPDENYGPSSVSYERWLRNRADAIERYGP